MNKKYDQYNKDELIKYIEKLEKQFKRTKFGLYWDPKIENEESANLLLNNIPVLNDQSTMKIRGNINNTSVLIQGDNFHALTLLDMISSNDKLIDVIYIDPPYNTGARDWKYNNNYIDADDGYRHSKWLSFMKKRLVLSRNILKDDGIICVTIDDYELPNLWLLMNSIFGEENHLGTVTIRNNPGGRMTNKKISQVHEYALFFGKSKDSRIKRIPVKPEDKSHNYKLDENGKYYLKVNLRKQGVDSDALKPDGSYRERYFPIYYDPINDRISTEEKLAVEIWPIDNKGHKRIWRRNQKGLMDLYESGNIILQEIKGKYQIYFRFRGGLDGEMPKSIWQESIFSASDHGTKKLNDILGQREKFQYPKAVEAVKKSIVACSNNKDAVILDFFAGSGTTGQAVLELNQEDGGNRRFILCTNNENNICDEVTYPRLKTVITGIRPDGSKYSDGISANLHYFKTDFIPRSGNDDQDKYNLVEKVNNLLCISEDVFNLLEKDERYYIYSSYDMKKEVYMYIDYIEQNSFNTIIEKINLSEAKEKILYLYSTDNTIDESVKELLKGVQVKPIPSKIFEIYKEIVEDINRG